MAITTPPFRTSLLTQNGVPFGTGNGDIQTTRDWWMYWQQLTDRSNANSKLAGEGAHADRPDPGSMPDGALYYENDRGVLYANTLGVWQYVAGTMYGTLSPDQRPPDLGTHDAGFEFRGTDQPREFLWSQTAWVEVTAVQYGPHSARPNPTTIMEGALYVESDRGGVIYQRATPTGTPLWQYLAGTMWGTLVPDQRPTDLGVHDAGFDFRTNVAPPREFIWNQTAWVEVTPVGGAANLTHPNVVTKVDTTAGGIVEGGITDLSAANSARVYIAAGGNVGVNTTNPLNMFQVRGSVDNNLAIRYDGSTPGLGAFNDAGSAAVGMHFNATKFNFIAGNVGLNVPTPTFQLQLSTDSAAKTSTSTWSVSSDPRLKENIEPVTDDSLKILRALNWVRYQYNGQGNTERGLKGVGLSAQELQAHLPESVRSFKAKLTETDADETDLLAIDYHHILVHAARAIQQLSADVERLKAIVES